MFSKMELVLVIFAFATCFAQDIAFQEEDTPDDTNNRVGAPSFGRPGRPGRPNLGFQRPGQFPQNSNQGFNPNGQFPDFNEGFNPNGQFPQNSNQGFNPNGQLPQNSNQGFNPNGQFPPNTNSNGGLPPSTSSGSTQTNNGALRPPPVSTQKIINLVPCSCPFTPEYSPVCGSDSQTYLNAAVLNCFRVCGFDVSVARTAACAQTAGRTRISK